jgi:hypothetical protein
MVEKKTTAPTRGVFEYRIQLAPLGVERCELGRLKRIRLPEQRGGRTEHKTARICRTGLRDARTRIKTLTSRTRKDNARFFGSEDAVPFHVITMGIGTILDTRKTLLLATGKNKAQAVAQAVEGPITSMNPASALQLHPSAIFCLDEEAASELSRTDYYRWVFDNKPSWQKI